MHTLYEIFFKCSWITQVYAFVKTSNGTLRVCTFHCMSNVPEKNKNDLVNDMQLKYFGGSLVIPSFEMHQINEMNEWKDNWKAVTKQV